MARSHRPTIEEIMALKENLERHYQRWRDQMREDDRFYTQNYSVVADAGTPPDGYEQVRPPSATQIIEMAADHSTGNTPRLHVPRRKETTKAQEQTTIMEKAGSGFWYRSIANASTNILRAWAQSGALRGAIGGSLLYDPDAMPDKPVPSEHGGTESEEYKALLDEYEALARSAWPFKLDYRDPLYMLPDPETEGRTYIIEAFKRKAFDVKRAWPNWDYTTPAHPQPMLPTDDVEFVSYWDREYRAELVSGFGQMTSARALINSGGGVVKHGYGFLPKFFLAGGYGSPFGNPEDRYAGLLTRAKDLFSLEARRMTHLDAIIAQEAFPTVVTAPGVILERRLGGLTIAPSGMKAVDAIHEFRPQIPVQEIVIELQNIRGAIQRATLPDSLASEAPKSGESGYLRSLQIGTGRSRIRSLTAALERTCEWATSGFYRLVENKVKGPVSVWGKGMGAEDEFVTIQPDDISGHYEVYVDLAPSLPQDASTDISNGLKLYQAGGVPMRDVLETYAGRENSEELMVERLGEDVLRSQPMFAKLVQDAMAVTQVTPGPIGTPGFTSGLLSPPNPALGPAGAPGANPMSNAGVGAPHSIPTAPATAGSLAQANQIVGQTSNGGAPVSAPVQGIQRGRP